MSYKTTGSGHYQKQMREDDVKQSISRWLIDNRIEVWWEKKNDYGHGVFTTVTGTRKPDLLLKWKDNVVLTEVKNATSFSNVYDSFFQLLGYYNNISTVSVNNERLAVTGFVAATQCSIQGHLFTYEPLQTYETFGDGRRQAISQGYLPYSEYKLSEMFVRLLWRAKQKPDVFIGALLSSVLNFPSDDPIPTILAKRNGQQVFKEVRA